MCGYFIMCGYLVCGDIVFKGGWDIVFKGGWNVRVDTMWG
jgi:hypothetical protein